MRPRLDAPHRFTHTGKMPRPSFNGRRVTCLAHRSLQNRWDCCVARATFLISNLARQAHARKCWAEGLRVGLPLTFGMGRQWYKMAKGFETFISARHSLNALRRTETIAYGGLAKYCMSRRHLAQRRIFHGSTVTNSPAASPTSLSLPMRNLATATCCAQRDLQQGVRIANRDTARDTFATSGFIAGSIIYERSATLVHRFANRNCGQFFRLRSAAYACATVRLHLDSAFAFISDRPKLLI